MAGKSIEDILRQQAAQRQAEIQRQQTHERAIWEQRERARLEYLARTRMNERLFINPAASSPAAGGGKINVTSSDFPSVTAQSTIISWVDTANDLWKFVVYNFGTGQLSEVHTTDLTGTDWNLSADDRTVQYKGFTLDFNPNVGSGRRFYFVNAEGTVVGEKSLDTFSSFQYTERAVSYYGFLSGVRTLYHFDGDNVRTHTFGSLSLDINDGSGEDVTKDGSIIVEAPDNNSTYYIARPNGDLVDVSQYLTSVPGSDSFRSDYNSDFIIKTFTVSSINIVSQEGALVNTFDISSFNMDSLNESYFYGENCATFDYDNGVDTRLVVSYDRDSNQFVSLTFSSIPNYYDSFFHRRSWYQGASSFGKNLNVVSFVNTTSDSLGVVGTELNFWYLPKGATEFNHVNLSPLGTVSYIGGDEGFTSNRSFTLGENPIFMYAPEGGEIIIAFLEESGFSTQSTGILAASCSNIWGHNIGEHSFAVFDVGSDRIWQIYDANSIVEETQTTTNWSWGDADQRQSLRNGTLAVIDSSDTSNSFIYTTEIGLTAGPTGFGKIYNYPDYGNNTGLAYEYQVITQFIPGEELNEYVEGFYILSKSGLSEYVEFFVGGPSPSATYSVNDYCIGSEMISFRLQDSVTGNHRYQVYNTSTLVLLHDWNPGDVSTDYNSYDNRFVAEYDDGSGNVEFRLVSLLGVEILNLQTTNFNRESNDTVDND